MRRRLLLLSGICFLGIPAAAQTPAFDAGFAEFRRARGLPATAQDARLAALAAAIAADNEVRGRIDHRDGQGRDLAERAAATRVAWRIVAENLMLTFELTFAAIGPKDTLRVFVVHGEGKSKVVDVQP